MKKFSHIVSETFDIRSFDDRRKKVNRIIVSYLDENDIEYRKRYEFDRNTSYDDMIKQIPQMIN